MNITCYQHNITCN